MVETQEESVTVTLKVQTLKKARAIAERRSTSISALVEEQIASLVDKDEEYERAAASAIEGMRRGFHMGGGPLVRREELYDR